MLLTPLLLVACSPSGDQSGAEMAAVDYLEKAYGTNLAGRKAQSLVVQAKAVEEVGGRAVVVSWACGDYGKGDALSSGPLLGELVESDGVWTYEIEPREIVDGRLPDGIEVSVSKQEITEVADGIGEELPASCRG